MEEIALADLVGNLTLKISFTRTAKTQLFIEFLEERISENKDSEIIKISIPPLNGSLGIEAFSPEIQELLILLARRGVVSDFHSPNKVVMRDGVIHSVKLSLLYVSELDMRKALDSSKEIETQSISFTILKPKELIELAKQILELKSSLVTETALGKQYAVAKKEVILVAGKIHLFLSEGKVVNLCSDSQQMKCSQLGREMMRVLTHLIESPDYVPTKDIANALTKNSKKTVISAIQKINKKVAGLGFPYDRGDQEGRFIQSSDQDLGYRINRTLFQIVPVEAIRR